MEIAVSGSVAAGWADAHSDIELNLVADAVPDDAARLAWLRRLGAEEVDLDVERAPDGTRWSFFRVDGVGVEAGWQDVGSLERWLARLLAAETVDHVELVAADAVVHALPLRTEGALARWQDELSTYPDALGARLIADAVFDWRPHWTRLPLARRGERLRLTKVLVEDCLRVLRILFALDRRWEPDWKWLDRRLVALARQPPRLRERLDEVLLERDLEEAVYACDALIRDTLELAGEGDDIRRAYAWVTRELESR